MKPAVGRPRMGPMTQGTIFSCAVAEDYPRCTTHGLIITARCDVANDKVRTYNYIPIVALNDWLHHDGRLILADRLLSETRGKVRGILKDSGFSPSILETESPRMVLKTLYEDTDNNPKGAKFRPRFRELCDRYELACQAAASDAPEGICIQLAEVVPSLRDGLITELATQRLAGYYFLDCLELDGDDNGYVALLREVQAIPRAAAMAVASGLDAFLFAEMCRTEPLLVGRLRIGTDEMAMPIGIVLSPNLEHLMQSFSLLFGRIGIPDLELTYLAGLWSRQPSVKGASKCAL
jgi:hypothetical protein